MGFANAPAIEYDAVANLVIRVIAGFNRPGNVDPRHHRKLAHHRPLAGNRQAILVIERRHRHPHGHIALRQLAFVNLLHRRAIAGVILLDQNSLEHVLSPFQCCKLGSSACMASRFSTNFSITKSTTPTTITPAAMYKPIE